MVGALKFTTEQPCGFRPVSTRRMVPSLPDGVHALEDEHDAAARLGPQAVVQAVEHVEQLRRCAPARRPSRRARGEPPGCARRGRPASPGSTRRSSRSASPCEPSPCARPYVDAVDGRLRTAPAARPARSSPRPGALSRTTSPPWATTMARTIASPSPEPPRVARPRTRRRAENRSNARSATSAVMPGPSSCTSTHRAARRRCARAPTPAVPARRVHQRVADQVAHHLAQPVLVALDGHAFGHVGGDRPVGRHGPRVGGGVDAEHAEVDRARGRAGDPRRAGPAAGGRRPASHAHRLLLGAAHRLVEVGRRRRARRGGTARRSRGSW